MSEDDDSCKRSHRSGGPVVDYHPREVGMRAFLGIISRAELKDDSKGRDIAGVVIHPSYRVGVSNSNSDLALFRLAKPIPKVINSRDEIFP